MNDRTYQKFIKRWEEVIDIPPQSLGPLTGIYKGLTKKLKVMPLPWFVAVSAGVVLGLYLVAGPGVTLLTSILQGAF